MPRPLKSVVRSIRLTPEEAARYARLEGYRQLWSFSELVTAGLELLHQEEQEYIAAARPLPAPPPPSKKKGRKKT
jgi:hypothetical protein